MGWESVPSLYLPIHLLSPPLLPARSPSRCRRIRRRQPGRHRHPRPVVFLWCGDEREKAGDGSWAISGFPLGSRVHLPWRSVPFGLRTGPMRRTMRASARPEPTLAFSGLALGFGAPLAWKGPGVVPAITSLAGLLSFGASATWHPRNIGALETVSIAGQFILGGVAPGPFARWVFASSPQRRALSGHPWDGRAQRARTPVSRTASDFVAILTWSGPMTGFEPAAGGFRD